MKRWRDLVSTACGLIAAVFLAAMLLLTVADVVLRATINVPIRGVYDLVELFLAATFFFALPCVFLRDENIVVNSIDDVAPRSVPMLKRLAEFVAVAVLVVMAWQGYLAARDSYEFNDVTADLGLPRVWHWLTLLIGVIGAAIAALVMAVRGDDRSEDRSQDRPEARS
jgi:TRAP-type C4-dicarboxylate transport system permease small subunit